MGHEPRPHLSRVTADAKGGEAAWASFCQALFASAEFRYLP